MLLEATFVELKPPGKLSIGLETVSSLGCSYRRRFSRDGFELTFGLVGSRLGSRLLISA
jgi:hypothetical protein